MKRVEFNGGIYAELNGTTCRLLDKADFVLYSGEIIGLSIEGFAVQLEQMIRRVEVQYHPHTHTSADRDALQAARTAHLKAAEAFSKAYDTDHTSEETLNAHFALCKAGEAVTAAEIKIAQFVEV